MADKWTALHAFWNRFGIPAYDENTVPENAELPYITYEGQVSSFDEIVFTTASIWYKSNSWAEISRKAEEISDYIGGGAGEPYDGGRLWVTRGAPFAQRMSDESDTQIRRVIIQITAEYQ